MRRLWPVVVSLSLMVTIGLLYWLKPDWAAAVTIFPAWTWVPLFLLALAGRKPLVRRGFLVVLAGCVVYVFAFSEEWTSLLRRADVSARVPGTVRVVSLNCAGGTLSAAEEVARFDPDIVLLQESPLRPQLDALARRLWPGGGSALVGPDASILTRWPMKPVVSPKSVSDFVLAHIETPFGRFGVVSLRLMPPVFAPDLYSPDAWRQVADNRRARRLEIQEIASALSGETLDIAGGDFNAQSGDAVFRSMPSSLRDSFYEAGAGWGHTAVNDFPLARIDQVWVSARVKPLASVVVKTLNSDHRMVVCDFRVD